VTYGRGAGVISILPLGPPGTFLINGVPWAVPPTQPGHPLLPSQFTPGSLNLYDQWTGVDVLPSQQHISLVASAHQTTSGDAILWADTWLSRRLASAVVSPGYAADITLPPTIRTI
jgi:hypothetical protein